MLPGDRLVCAFVEPLTLGYEFRQWLLHVTIVPWFRLGSSSEHICEGLSKSLQPIVPFVFTTGRKVRFGPRQNRPALLVEEPGPFVEIEHRVRNYFHAKHAWLVDETTNRPRRFKPHLTIQTGSTATSGDAFICDRLYIVEQHGIYKTIVAEVHFGPATA